MSNMPPPVNPAQTTSPTAPAPKKTSPWVWVAVGCGTLLVIVVVVVVAFTVFVGKKAKDFAKTVEKNPAVAAAKVAAAVNPDIEVVSSDDEAGTVTLRNKKTGEVITIDAKDVQKGRIAFSDEKGKKVHIEAHGEGEQQSMRISSGEGEVVVGSDVGLPEWVPLFPGAKLEGAMAAKGKGGATGGAGFATDASVAEVLAFYERELKARGFSPSVSKFEQNGQTVGGMVQGTHTDGRSLMVSATREQGKTRVGLSYENKGR
ncbi:MAG: hypothetical protein ACP5NF_07740 [Thermoanaerobaculum sp.]